MTAGSDIGKGLANSLTETLVPALSCARIARLVGSASAAKVRSRALSLYLTIRLSVTARRSGCQAETAHRSPRHEKRITRARHPAGELNALATIYDLKPLFQARLRPIADALARRGITANQVTLAALALSLAHGAWLALMPDSRWPFLLLPMTLFLRMALNAVDGMLAREHGMKSAAGAVLNELSDVTSDTALYLPFALVAGVSAPLVVLVVVLAIVGEMAGALGPMLGVERRYDGPLGKSDRAFAFGLLAFLIGLGLTPGTWTTIYLAVLLGLAALTVWNRARKIVGLAGSGR